MKENLIEESLKNENENEKCNRINILKDKIIRIVFIIDIISFLSFILFIIINQKIIYIIFAVSCFIISVYLIIIILIKMKKIKKKNPGKEYNDEIEEKEEIKIEKDSEKEIKLNEIEEKEEKIKIIEEIANRHLLKENDHQFKVRNENLDLIEKAGKLKSLADGKIKKEKKSSIIRRYEYDGY